MIKQTSEEAGNCIATVITVVEYNCNKVKGTSRLKSHMSTCHVLQNLIIVVKLYLGLKHKDLTVVQEKDNLKESSV